MLSKLLSTQRRFAKDDHGSVAVLFGLMFIVITFTAGMAIDYGRIVNNNVKISAAADAAVLAAGRVLSDGRYSDDEIQALAEKYFEENLVKSGMTLEYVQSVQINIDRRRAQVSIDVDTNIPLTLTQVLGPTHADVPVTTTVTFDQSDVELSMALDITGSMRGSKLSDLKSAAKDLIEIMLPEGGTTNNVRIAIAPYAASVNAGPFAAVVSDNTSLDDCVWERTGPQAFTDAAPGVGTFLLAGAPPVDIDPTEGVSSYSCPSAEVTPLSSDKTKLDSEISSLTAGGFTAGHLGAAWASYLLSPDWSTIWPASSTPTDYDDVDTIKVALFMTDGIFNTAYANGDSDYQALEICDTMKGNDVVIYAVGFQAPSGAQETLRSCASTDDHYFAADDGDELRTAFVSIAKQLSNLRISN